MFRSSMAVRSGLVIAIVVLIGQGGPTRAQTEFGIHVGPDSAVPSDGGQSGAGASSIDFDNAEAPCNFADTVALTDEYAAQGVIFSGPGGNDGAAILNECSNFGVTGHSPPNFLAFNADGGLIDGGVPRGPETLTFSPTVTMVQMAAGVGQPVTGTVTLEAFDSSGALVDVDSFSVAPDMQVLAVQGAEIETAVITVDTMLPGSNVFDVLVVDDLVFESSAVPAIGGPGTTLLVMALLTGAVYFRRRAT